MILKGKPASQGIAIGMVLKIEQDNQDILPVSIKDPQSEIARFENARALATTQLGSLAVTMAKKIGKENSLLFEIHQMMLEDMDYRKTVEDTISRERVCAEYAVTVTGEQFSESFSTMDDEYMRERAIDIIDVSRRIVQILTGKQQELFDLTQPAILYARDFTPSETAQMDRAKVLALITSGGSVNSHTAIFARTMEIPAVIGLGEGLPGSLFTELVAVDGEMGEVHISPDKSTLDMLYEKQRTDEKQTKLQQKYIGKPTITQAGRVVKLYANIASPADIQAVLENDAEGIGLFRSEFLYLESSSLPSEQMQFEAYRFVAERMNGKGVIIRTLDIGADKQVSYLNLGKEENPALGMRAIRICLTQSDIFRTQLRAILRASAYGKIRIMFPMIASVAEVQKAKQCIQAVKDELSHEEIAFDNQISIGIMIETPASALISDFLAREVDFFSIGTNDLIQYTLAMDRQNDSIADFCDPHHPAVLRLIEMVTRNAHDNGIWVGICGELAADTTFTQKFVQIGVDELSVAPSAILKLRQLICNL